MGPEYREMEASSFSPNERYSAARCVRSRYYVFALAASEELDGDHRRNSQNHSNRTSEAMLFDGDGLT